jgi:hypothetical protein
MNLAVTSEMGIHLLMTDGVFKMKININCQVLL